MAAKREAEGRQNEFSTTPQRDFQKTCRFKVMSQMYFQKKLSLAFDESATVVANIPGMDCESNCLDPAMVFSDEKAEVCADAQFLVEGMWDDILQHLILKKFFQ